MHIIQRSRAETHFCFFASVLKPIGFESMKAGMLAPFILKLKEPKCNEHAPKQ